MAISMTILAQSNPVRNFVSEFWMRGKRLDVVRMYLYGFTVAFVVACAAILTGVVIALVYSFAPFDVFRVDSSEFILMALGWFVLSLCLVGCYGKLRAHFEGYVSKRTGQRAELFFSALLFVFWHRLTAVRAGGCNLHAVITDSFGVGFLHGLKAFFTDKTGLADSVSVGVEMGSARSARFNSLLAVSGNAWSGLSAIGAWLKGLFVAGETNPVVPCVTSAYYASVFHNIQFTTNRQWKQVQRMSDAFPGIEIKRVK